MSIKIISRVLDHSEQRGAARLLLVALADFANDDGVCWPGTAKLALKINESERYTRLLIRKLLDSGELLRIVGGGRGRSTLYGIASGLDHADLKILNKALDRAGRINPVPEYRVSERTSRPKAAKDDHESRNPVPEYPVLYNPDLYAQRSVIFVTDDEVPNTAPESDETPHDENANRDHDPLVVEVESARAKKIDKVLVGDLIRLGVYPKPAREIARMGLDPPTVLRFAADMLTDGWNAGGVADYLRDAPPKAGDRYEPRLSTGGPGEDGSDRPRRGDRRENRERSHGRPARPGDRAYRGGHAPGGPVRAADGE